MKPTELKKLIEKKSLPSPMIWVDNNHSLVNHYLDQISVQFNRKIKKIFHIEDVGTLIPFDEDRDNTVYLLYLTKKEILESYHSLDGVMAIFMVDIDPEVKIPMPLVVFEKVSRNACLVFLENYVQVPQKKKDEDKKEVDHYISRGLLERLVDYFENDLDLCMNEIKKVEVLELTSSWDHPFEALLNCLPKKDGKLRSLSWFSGGDIDTCQVLYNLYIKKLRTLTEASKKEQETWSRLVKEAVWCEACMVSGLLGDYVIDYLKLVESSLPGDFKIQYFPPVFYKDLEKFPEWIPKEEE